MKRITMKQIAKTAAVLAAMTGLFSASVASAQELRLPTTKRPPLDRQIELDPNRLRPGFDSGARYWIAPLLENSPGTISGEIFTIDGKRLVKSFDLTIINTNADRDIKAEVGCFDAGGNYLLRYRSVIDISKSAAHRWRSGAVTPPPTTNGADEDMDTIWCAVSADAPLVVFGWSERRFGSDISRTHFSLERVEFRAP